MSKYNLIDIYEGMSDKEFSAAEEAGRLEKHPEKDKIQKIKDLMSKEKSIEELDSTFKEGDKVSVFMRGTKADSPEEATIVMMDPSGVAIVKNKDGDEDEVYIKDMNQIKESNKEEQLKNAYAALDKAEQDGDIRKQELALAAIDLIKGDLKENNIEEMTGETFNRIDGLTNQNLKAQFLDKFSEIYEDILEDDNMFDVSDIIDYLCAEMQAYAVDTKMDVGNISLEESNKVKSVNLREEIGPTGIAISQNQLDNLKKFGAIPGLEVMVQDKDGSNVRKVDYTLTNTDFEKGDDDYDYLEEGLKEHFSRFMKDYQ